jgi:hypothetical protein
MLAFWEWHLSRTIGPFEKKDVKLFCFNKSVEVSLDDIVAALEVSGLFTKMQTHWFLFGLASPKRIRSYVLV